MAFKEKHLAGGYLAINKSTLEQLPMVDVCADKQEFIANLAIEIALSKQSDQSSDTSNLEAEIDRMVYELYGLTDEEIKIVEGTAN